jgi:hypothetical protein
VKLEGLAWAGAASKAALKRMAADEPFAASREPVKALHFRQRRAGPNLSQRAQAGLLWLAGLFSLAVAVALFAELVIERYWK